MEERCETLKEVVGFGRTSNELVELHLEAMFIHDSNNRLRRINEPWPSNNSAPLFVLGRSVDGVAVCRFRHDVPDKLVEQLKKLCAEELLTSDIYTKPKHFTTYMYLLQAKTFTMGPCWVIAEERVPLVTVVGLTRENIAGLLRGNFEELISRIDHIQPCIAVICDGQAVSTCCSVRISPSAHEAGVETREGFRGKGYATAAVAGWAAAVRQLKAVPLYSTLFENVASQNLAKKLALRLYGVNFTIR